MTAQTAVATNNSWLSSTFADARNWYDKLDVKQSFNSAMDKAKNLADRVQEVDLVEDAQEYAANFSDWLASDSIVESLSGSVKDVKNSIANSKIGKSISTGIESIAERVNNIDLVQDVKETFSGVSNWWKNFDIKKSLGNGYDSVKELLGIGTASTATLLSADGAIEPSTSFDSRTMQMQSQLKALGFDLEHGQNFANDGVDGYYGPVTTHAVKAFQSHFGLEVTGIATPETLDLMQEKFNELPPELQTAQQNVAQTSEQNHETSSTYFERLAQVESSNNPLAQNPRSSAKGRYQFINSTGRQYGLDSSKFGTPEYTAQEEIAVRALTKDNHKALVSGLEREPSGGELYLAHQQGAAGALRLLKDPDALAINTVGIDAIKLNGGHTSMTNQDFANKWVSKFEKGYNPAQTPDIQVASKVVEESITPTAPAPS